VQSHRRWREGSKLAHASASRVPVGTMFSFSLNERATVELAFIQRRGGRTLHGRCVAKSSNRHLPACTLERWRGRIGWSAKAGTNKLAFQGRISRSRKLPPGAYTLLINATDAARHRAGPRRLSFTIIK
jgi:hypothetical protein